MEQRFDVDLRVLNPNNKDISVDGLDFELDINGSRLARGVSSEAFTLPRLGETVTTVQVTTSTVDIIRKTLSLSGTEPLQYRLKGRVHLGGLAGTLKFDESGEVALGNTTRTL
jgi:LEA14-like dessication related protein